MQKTMYRDKLKRLNHQLNLSQQVLQNHPLVSKKLTILQTLLRFFALQTQWTLALPVARLMMAFQTGLLSYRTDQSQTGFIGPTLGRMQQGMSHLLKAILKSSDSELEGFLMAFIETLSLSSIYVATQTLGNWKTLFPPQDPAAAKKAGLLLREMGLTFMLGSRLLESATLSVTQSLGLSEKDQQKVTALTLSFILLLLFLVDEKDNPNQQEFLTLLQRFCLPTLDTIEEIVKQAQERSFVEAAQIPLLLNQLQLIRRSLETADLYAFKYSLRSGFELFDMPLETVYKDLKKVIIFCSQLNASFRNTFYQAERATTTVVQAA